MLMLSGCGWGSEKAWRNPWGEDVELCKRYNNCDSPAEVKSCELYGNCE